MEPIDIVIIVVLAVAVVGVVAYLIRKKMKGETGCGCGCGGCPHANACGGAKPSEKTEESVETTAEDTGTRDNA